MDKHRKVIIIGGNHHNTLGVIRSVGRKGLRPDVILTSGQSSSFVLKSKYIERSWVVDGSDAAITLLRTLSKDKEYKPVIITCHDIIASKIDLHYNQLSPNYILPGCEKQGRVTELMNKKKMGELAQLNGLNVPHTWIVDRAVVSDDQDIIFPCIIKPIASNKGSKSEIHVVDSKKQLNEVLYGMPGEKYVVQQYVKKDFEFQLIGCSLQSGEEIIIPGVSIIIRQPQTTNTGFLHYRSVDSSFESTIEKCKNFIRYIGYSGLFSIEFLRDREGVDYFMEINYRNDGNSIAVTNSGVNLPFIWYLSSIGADYSEEIQPIHEEYVIPELDELSLLRGRIISLKEWKSDMRRATSYMDYAQDDPAPTQGWTCYNKKKWKVIFIYLIKVILGIYEKH